MSECTEELWCQAEQVYTPACERIETEPLTLDGFMRWFYDNIKVPIHDGQMSLEKIPAFGDN